MKKVILVLSLALISMSSPVAKENSYPALFNALDIMYDYHMDYDGSYFAPLYKKSSAKDENCSVISGKEFSVKFNEVFSSFNELYYDEDLEVDEIAYELDQLSNEKGLVCESDNGSIYEFANFSVKFVK